MRKIHLVALASVFAGGSAFAQSKYVGPAEIPVQDRVKERIDGVQEIQTQNRGGGPIWQDDFSNPSTWVLDHDETANSLDWEVGTDLGCGGSFPIDTIQSTTKANGYAMIDSDEYGGATGGNEIEDSWLTTADSIDLTNYPNVVVEFETWYRRYNYERPFLVVSTDGVTWPELTPDTDISGMPNVFDLWPDFPDVTSLETNPTKMRVNISEVAGGQPKVWLRFHWTGTWGYAWFVDDVKVVEQPANDLVAESAYITHNGSGDEYGRIPQSQLLSSFDIGGQYFNFGYQDQNNVVESFDIATGGSSVMSSSTNTTLAMSDSTYNVDETVTPSTSPLALGLYEGTFLVESDEETAGGANYDNNTYLRNFEVTADRYSLDGIGVHPAGYENLVSIGTNSFADAADGFQLLTYYDFSQNAAIMGLEIMLSASTVPGGTIICTIQDTANVFGDDLSNPLEESDVIDITQAHVDAGMVTVMFPEPFETDVNAYFAAVEMFSNANESDIRILDDLTVPQPATSSMIFTPDDQTVYTNGNAAAIRLITADNVSVGELNTLEGVSVYPNPSNGVVNVRFANADLYTIDVFNVLGERVHTEATASNTTIDLNGLDAGVYMVVVSTETARFTERLIVE
jgi:hypothetical protein